MTKYRNVEMYLQKYIRYNFMLPPRCDIFPFVACDPAYIYSYLPTFRDNLSVPTSRVKQYKNTSWTVLPKIGPIVYPETSVNNYESTPINIPEERISHIRRNIDIIILYTFELITGHVFISIHKLLPYFSRWRSVR
jgi:hypothetical protein